MSRGGQTSNQLVGDYMTLRKAVGWIAVSLPFAVFLGNWIIFSHHHFGCLAPISYKLPDSLSGYYYSHMRDVFIGAMCAAGVFLVFYRGFDKVERWVTNFAGGCALGIALFPTKPPTGDFLQTNRCGPVTPVTLQPAPHGAFVGVLHVVFLCGLMGAIAVLCFWWIRRQYSPDELNTMTDEERAMEHDAGLKARNNKIYLVCAVAIVLAAVLAVVQAKVFSRSVQLAAPWLLYAETIAFLAFGLAWSVKGRALFALAKRARNLRRRLGAKRGAGLSGLQIPQPAAVSGAATPGLAPGPSEPDPDS